MQYLLITISDIKMMVSKKLVVPTFIILFFVFNNLRRTLELKHFNNAASFNLSLKLKHFNLSEGNFPTPELRRCNEKNLCEFANVCFSSQDGMLVFGSPELNSNGNDWYSNSSFRSLSSVTLPRRPVLVKHETYTKLQNVHFVDSMFVVNCWRSSLTNPAHLLMGIGKLFVASTGYYGGNLTNVDLILYHQCSSLDNWPYGIFVENLIYNRAVLNGVVRTNRTDNRLFLPFSSQTETLPQVNEMVICGRTVFQELKSVALYLGPNPREVVKKWFNMVDDYLLDSGLRVLDSQNVTVCPRNLTFALWKRTEGSALRHLVNEEEIKALVAEYTNNSLKIVSANSSTSINEQISIFRSFDILITPHGSHLSNMIFGTGNAVFIEIQAAIYSDIFSLNGKTFAKHYILSTGHYPNNTDLEKLMEACVSTDDQSLTSVCPRRTRLNMVQSDLQSSI